MRDFSIYSNGLNWGGHQVHVELVVEPVVRDAGGQAPPKRNRRN